ncbi:helix-turn-helix domain-containing protein [Nonomuraea basaltis]|uniref:helix-turn-helix domain-containing protein n=1 Tax=Nonomuraea basaltis TaxID=2495887 RepID=UPI00110C6976|nr:helix-turn-helix domain-containing protein [Nonomuraea basaltis]TMR94872.1 helix-turn-helix domain-containing protein [Nonomuraea basaltis]
MDLNQPEPLGTWLLRQARNRGITAEQVADLLGIPVHRIRQFTTATDLDDLPVRAIRAMASQLDLPWPDWLQPVDIHPDDRTDPTSPAHRAGRSETDAKNNEITAFRPAQRKLLSMARTSS